MRAQMSAIQRELEAMMGSKDRVVAAQQDGQHT
jgi:hypothetical protein